MWIRCLPPGSCMGCVLRGRVPGLFGPTWSSCALGNSVAEAPLSQTNNDFLLHQYECDVLGNRLHSIHVTGHISLPKDKCNTLKYHNQWSPFAGREHLYPQRYHRMGLGKMQTWTGEQRVIMPLVRLSMLLLVFFRPSGSVSVLLDAAYDPRLNTLSSSTSGVYLRTNDTSTSADSDHPEWDKMTVVESRCFSGNIRWTSSGFGMNHWQLRSGNTTWTLTFVASGTFSSIASTLMPNVRPAEKQRGLSEPLRGSFNTAEAWYKLEVNWSDSTWCESMSEWI